MLAVSSLLSKVEVIRVSEEYPNLKKFLRFLNITNEHNCIGWLEIRAFLWLDGHLLFLEHEILTGDCVLLLEHNE